jgi:hypothetical protein
MKYIDTSDLALWASKPSSKAELPLLISRLIRSTTKRLSTLSIPKGKGTYRGGWDGKVDSPSETEFVPEGLSLWEFGTAKGAASKAESDFTKRTNDPERYNIAQATYIFVTPHVWENAGEWVKQKLKQGKWKDIRVYDANKLVEWFELAPIQSYWLAKEIGRMPSAGVEIIEDYWNIWRAGRGYQLIPKVITTGREENVKTLHATLHGTESLITVQALSRDEAIAFIVGSIMQLDTEEQETTLAKCIIVNNEASFKLLVNNYEKLILIAKLEESNAFNHAVGKGHTVIVPLGADDNFEGIQHIKLPRLCRDGFIEALEESGLSRDKAQELSRESSRDITIFRRMEKFDHSKPAWAAAGKARDIIPALLLGKWDEKLENEKELLSILAGEAYETYIAKLTAWKNTPDAPVYNIDTQWRISSALDIWSHIGKYVTSADLEKLRAALLKAVQYIKPMLELEIDQRYMAAVYGKESEYSKTVRSGLLQSAILIAVFGDDFGMNIPHGSQTFVDGLIGDLLHNADDKLWRSLDDVMPLLAESSPSSFLTCIERALQGEKPVLAAIFEQIGDTIFSINYHTGVLWALESLAWLPDYLARVTLILGKLEAITPQTKIHNSPINSLLSIYVPWHPQTHAVIEQRIEAINTLAIKFPDVAWKLSYKLLPTMSWSSLSTQKCRWRKFGYPDQQNVTYTELYKAHSAAIDMCLSIAGMDVVRVSELLEKSVTFSGADRNKVLEYIIQRADNLHDPDHTIYNVLRRLVGHHRTHRTAKWALTEAELQRYVELYYAFSPAPAVEAQKWLFQTQSPVLMDGEYLIGHAKWYDEVLQRRIKALMAMQEEVGLNGIIDLFPSVIPLVIGNTLGHIVKSEDELYEVFTSLLSEDKAKLEALHAVIHCVYFKQGLHWITKLYEKVKVDNSEVITLANIVIALPSIKDVVDWVGKLDEEVQKLYWTNCNALFNQLDAAYKPFALQKLVDVNRFGAALQQLGWYFQDIPTELAYTVLEAAATIKSIDNAQTDTYHITRIFEQLDERGDLDERRMATLEMYYLGHLTSYGSSRPPRTLHKELGACPKTFVELLTWMYLADTDEQNERERQNRIDNPSLGEAAYHLLESWETIPGTDPLGNIDYEYLEDWIFEVRGLANAAGRRAVADMEIAKILACYPDKGDGNWPPEEICKILDEINTDSIRNNFAAAIINSRGAYSKGMFDGGESERALAEGYRRIAHQHAIKYPVTASIFEGVARHYDVCARREDADAKARDMEY